MAPKTILEAPREPAATRKPEPTVVAAIAKLTEPPVPPAPQRTPIAKVTYSLPYELREWARDLAFRARISESSIVETALAELRGLGDEEAIARVKASGGGLRRK
jgi:hypothetical protein